MKNNKTLIFTKILYAIFLIGTIISLFIVYKHIDGSFVFKFLVGYVGLAFFLLMYVPIITIMNSRKLKWVEIRKRLLKFILLFSTLFALGYGFDYFFRPSDINLLRPFSHALGLSFGISFLDITFLKSKES